MKYTSEFESDIYSDRLLKKIDKLNEEAMHCEYSTVNVAEVKKAIVLAKHYHGGQMRKSGEPYYSHPIEVAIIVSEHIFDTNILVTSILHDTIEDTALTKEIIADVFGEVIANWVSDLTRIKIDRKISAAETLNLLLLQNKKEVLCIKLSDRLHNMRTIDAISRDKSKKIVDETMDYFIPLAAYLELHTIEQELIQLCFKYLGCELYRRVIATDLFEIFKMI